LWTGPGTIDFGGTHALTLTGNVVHPAGTGGTQFTFSSGATIGGTGTLTNNGSLTLTSETVNTPLVNNGTITQTSTTSNINGALTQSVGSTLTLSSSTLIVANGFTNAGTINFSGARGLKTLTVTAGTLSNTGTITFNDSFASTINAPVVNTGAITVNSSATLSGLISSPAGASTIGGNGSALTLSGGVNIDGATVDNVILKIVTATPTLFDNVTFQNYGPTATPLLLNFSTGTATFNSLNYNTALTAGTGFHLGGTGRGNTINVASTNVVPGTTATAFNTWNTVTWPVAATAPTPVGTTHTWKGAVDTLWNTPTNWDVGSVPTTTSNVFIPAAPANQLTLTANAVVNDLTVETGANLDVYTFTLTSSGNVSAGNTIVGTTGTLIMNGAAKVLSGNIPNLTVSGTVSLAGSTTVTGNLNLSNATVAGGVLDTYGQTLTVTGQGKLKMINPLDMVTVNGNVTFSGGTSTGLLTAGVLNVKGNFTQSGTYNGVAYNHMGSFAASGTHKVVFNGTVAQTVRFANGTVSHLNHLEVSNIAGVDFITVSGFYTPATIINGNLSVTAAAPITGAFTVDVLGDIKTVAGSNISLSALKIGGVLSAQGTFTPAMTTFTGTSQQVPGGLGYQNVTVSGTALLSGATTVTGNLTLSNGNYYSGGVLDTYGQTLTVTGNLVTAGQGSLKMINALDVVTVNGNATFGGGSSTGLLTAGVLNVKGNFAQTTTSGAVPYQRLNSFGCGSFRTTLTPQFAP